MKLPSSFCISRFATASVLAATFLLSCGHLFAQAASKPVDLSGSQERRDDVGGELWKHFREDHLQASSQAGGGGTPGGGHIGAGTRLTKRFALLEGAEILKVTFTWDDPSIYVKAYMYQLDYYRSPAESYALEDYCHADDPLQSGSVVQQKQK